MKETVVENSKTVRPSVGGERGSHLRGISALCLAFVGSLLLHTKRLMSQARWLWDLFWDEDEYQGLSLAQDPARHHSLSFDPGAHKKRQSFRPDLHLKTDSAPQQPWPLGLKKDRRKAGPSQPLKAPFVPRRWDDYGRLKTDHYHIFPDPKQSKK